MPALETRHLQRRVTLSHYFNLRLLGHVLRSLVVLSIFVRALPKVGDRYQLTLGLPHPHAIAISS